MPAEDRSLTESVLRRDRWIAIAGLTAITLLAWAYVVAGAGTGMSVWETTFASLFPHRMADIPMDGMAAQPGAWAAGTWGIMLLMWWIMMIAMMTPSAAPVILLYARATRHAHAEGRLQQGAAPTTAFAGGYLLAWLGFSFAATFLLWLLARTEFVSAMTMSSNSAVLSAAILSFAGLYQLSPLKHICLRRCRNPADFISRHWRPGPSGALRMGLEHGLFCVGCCWVLMALLFVSGIMNILWIGILALFVIVEKIAPHGPRISWIAGLVLLAWGTTTLII